MTNLTFKKEPLGSRIVYSIRDGGIVIFPPGKYNKKYFVDSKYKELKTKEFNDLKSAKKYVVDYLTECNKGENKMSKKKKKLDEGMVMISSLLPVGRLTGLTPKREDNFVFKGLPGQFDKDGNKVIDENGNKIKEEDSKNVKSAKELLEDILKEFGHKKQVVLSIDRIQEMYNLLK